MATVASGTITHKLCQEQYMDGTIYDNLDDGKWGLELEYQIYPNSDYNAYTVAVRGRLRSDPIWGMNFDPKADAMILRLYCNGVNIAPTNKIDSFSIKEPSTDDPDSSFSSWYYWEYTPPSTGFSGISINGECELFTYTGDTGYTWGPLRTALYPSEIVAFHLWTSNSTTIAVEDLEPLVSVPSISNISNGNKYNNQAGVSASTNSIKVTWANSTGNSAPTNVQLRYKVSGGTFTDWGSIGVTSEKTLTGLDTRTTYVIQVRSKNSAGYSDIKEITIRTKSGAPTLTLEPRTISLEQITFKWTSNYGLSSLKYKVGSGSNVTISISDGATTGQFTVSSLSPGTKYTITVTGVETLDDSGSGSGSCEGTTLDKVILDTIGDKTHNTEFIVPAIKPSYPSSPTISTKLKFIFDDYTIEKNVSNGNNSITFTEAQWDEVYKRYGILNYCTVQVQAVTTGVNTYIDTKEICINLTGIQKTAHIGDSTNNPRRVQAWIGDSSGNIRRAIIWIGDSTNTPRRTI